jgi:hypothetical protein
VNWTKLWTILAEFFARLAAFFSGTPNPEPEPEPTPDPKPEPPPTLGGVGSRSTSPQDHPATGPVYDGHVWFNANAATNGRGTRDDPFNNIHDALNALRDGQRLIIQGDRITLDRTIVRNTTWTQGVQVFAYGTTRPIIDASRLTGDSRALYFTSGAREHWKGLEFTGGPHRGIDIQGSHHLIEDVEVHDFQRDGIYIADFGTGTRGNRVIDFRVWNLGDGQSTGTNVPDGVVATGNPRSPTKDNLFIRGLVENAPDDAFDAYRGRGTRWIDCVAIRSGYYANGRRAGDGNGFKAGGSDNDSGDNHAIGCLSILNAATGFTHNEAANWSGTNPNVVFDRVTAVRNGSAGVNLGGDQPTHHNVRRDAVIVANDRVGYVGPRGQAVRDVTTGVQFTNSEAGDYSLAPGSAGVNADGTVSGASDVALKIAREWFQRWAA